MGAAHAISAVLLSIVGELPKSPAQPSFVAYKKRGGWRCRGSLLDSSFLPPFSPSARMNLISPSTLFLHVLTLFGLGVLVSGLGSQCSAPVTSGTAAPSAPFWMEQIQHQGSAPFNSNPGGYQVFRNVKVCSTSLLGICWRLIRCLQ